MSGSLWPSAARSHGLTESVTRLALANRAVALSARACFQGSRPRGESSTLRSVRLGDPRQQHSASVSAALCRQRLLAHRDPASSEHCCPRCWHWQRVLPRRFLVVYACPVSCSRRVFHASTPLPHSRAT